MKRNVIITGCGASGIMAAITAAGRGASVTVLEKAEKPLKKLLMTGNGRCNLANLNEYEDSYRSSTYGQAKEVLKRFGVKEIIAFFESIGVFTKERDGWVYPVNDQASSVASHLLAEAERLKVRIKNSEEVTEIIRTQKGFICRTGTYEYLSDSVIVSSGTCAHYGKGFTDIAERTAGKFGIVMKDYSPALVPLIIDDKITGKWGTDRLSGRVALIKNGVEIISRKGELQLTSYGISGIPVLQISSYIDDDTGSKDDIYELSVDLLPEFEADDIIARAENAAAASGSADKRHFLSGLIPEKLFKSVYRSDESIAEFISRIKDLRLKVKARCGLEKAMVCAGGISLNELSENLESKKVKGLYFTGEAVDIDGDCGGYNLMWAWSSGYAAGKNV